MPPPWLLTQASMNFFLTYLIIFKMNCLEECVEFGILCILEMTQII